MLRVFSKQVSKPQRLHQSFMVYLDSAAINHLSPLPSLSSSRSSSPSSSSGVCPPCGCKRRGRCVRSASPPASLLLSACFQRWCSPCDTCGRFSSPAGHKGQRSKVQQLPAWAKSLYSNYMTQSNWETASSIPFLNSLEYKCKESNECWNSFRRNDQTAFQRETIWNVLFS